MGRKSCKKHQKRQQPQQQQLCKRWWSRVPSQFGPPDWAAEQEQWRAEGAPMCCACGEFGHDREDCPYGDPQYEEAWNQGLVGDAAEWFWAVDQTRPSPAHQREEPEHPQPKKREPERPQTKRGKPECPPLKPAPAEEECPLIPPPSPEEISWEAILRMVEASCWCPICRERGHSPLNCPLPPVRDLRVPPPPAEGACLLVSPPSPPPAEGACLLVPPPSSACWSHLRQQRESSCWSHNHQQRKHACWFRLHHNHQQREHACWFHGRSLKGRSPWRLRSLKGRKPCRLRSLKGRKPCRLRSQKGRSPCRLCGQKGRSPCRLQHLHYPHKHKERNKRYLYL
ncbi:UNVERIFIED_CONTAM: hypothetical protein FKN15_060710 [Acipenser sinensis]